MSALVIIKSTKFFDVAKNKKLNELPGVQAATYSPSPPLTSFIGGGNQGDNLGIVLMTTHDHQFMQSTANRIIELTPGGIIDRLCTYDEYLEDQRIHALQEELYA